MNQARQRQKRRLTKSQTRRLAHREEILTKHGSQYHANRTSRKHQEDEKLKNLLSLGNSADSYCARKGR